MIAVCGGLMRTGSIAMWQIMREIVLADNGRALKLGTDFFAQPRLDKWAEEDNYVLVKSHQYDDSLAGPIEKDRVKVVVTIRDMRDVVVSLMNFNDYAFEKAVAARAFHANPRNYHEWCNKIPEEDLLIIFYEEFIEDRTEHVLCVANFLGVDMDRPTAEEIDRKWNIESNRKRAGAGHKINSHNYMAKRHINTGETGQWRTALTEGQIDYIESDPEVGNWLFNLGYPWTYENGDTTWDSIGKDE